METPDTVIPGYTLESFYLFNNGEKDKLIQELEFANSGFRKKWMNDMKLLSISTELEVEVTSEFEQPCLICDVKTQDCGFNLPTTKLYADKQTIDQLQIEEGSSYKTSHLLEIMESFVRRYGHLPTERK
jgi:hypothetical protein